MYPRHASYSQWRSRLAHGMSESEILEEHPGLEKENFVAIYAFAADIPDHAYGSR